ncbi:peptide MFS transporter [Shewanella psychropiezotolerans]|uniref:Peptide MFS transporter n=1 Tax=Shewanella psychropiezotolerans TaxID=2593655 RepID=A0ABX5X5Y2_9GAMM|nr:MULTISPECIES: MFS transporter [Shewanella]MPY24147.1 peptide MFS transporter [Shewanella sp. YLB-07]QDO86701.1 peptide MFS transporter [Shewanella psychropiezotolerans]
MTQVTRTPLPKTFFVANTMEIFERLAWYGFFTLSSLYMTSPSQQGGLGFSDQERGLLQGMIPFFLYLFPVITGALADRYGYRKMFLISYAIMCPSYFILGQVDSFAGFFIAFMGVALGAACFKPVVTGTVARTTDDTNRGLGFGIFYMMVNIGGFLGPFIAGYVRAISWDWVFIMSSFWIAVNFIPALLFYKEPTDQNAQKGKPLKAVFADIQEVLGNLRFALLFFGTLIILMSYGAKWLSGQTTLLVYLAWFSGHYLWNLKGKSDLTAPWYKQKIAIGNKPFVIYLLILSGFWMVYQQIFITLPIYIRDFVDTSDLIAMMASYPNLLSFLAPVDLSSLQTELTRLSAALVNQELTAQAAYFDLVHYKVMVPVSELSLGLNAIAADPSQAEGYANAWSTEYRQINPEYMIGLNFLSIVFLQLLVSRVAEKFQALPVLVAGTVIIAFGTALGGVAHGAIMGGVMVLTSILVFSIGEMVASPKSQEYVASFAPHDKKAMFMGYYFVSSAIGFLLAGPLSGYLYSEVAKQAQRPDLMWYIIGAFGLITALGLILFHKFGVMKHPANKPVASEAEVM